MQSVFLLLILFLLSSPVQASEENPFFEWQSNNIQLLHGSGFELSDNDPQTTVTFEHADGWAYGDNFFYIDYVLQDENEINAEFSPRLSLGKISGRDLSFWIFQDFLISGTWEKARRFDAYLYGGGVDLNLPGFNLFQVNLYERDNPDFSGKGWQTTVVWSLPFEISGAKLSFDGYFDYADYEEGTTNFFSQPQLLLDVGSLAGAQESKLFAGIEYRYWHNKYGVDGVTEKVPQAIVKLAF